MYICIYISIYVYMYIYIYIYIKKVKIENVFTHFHSDCNAKLFTVLSL